MVMSVFWGAASLLVIAHAAKLPATWKTCARSLPPADYDTCILDGVTGAAQELTSIGAPSLGIPAMNPLKITALEIGQGSGPVDINIKLNDMELGNMGSVEISNIRHKDVENYKFGADLHMTKPLTVKSKYDLEGKVLLLPIKGKGDCSLIFDNVRAKLDLTGTPTQKGDDTFMTVTDFNVNFDTDKVHVNFENLFDGNKELGNNMNRFLNENWDIILKEMKPAVTEAIAAAFKGISNQIFTKVPYKKIFPS